MLGLTSLSLSRLRALAAPSLHRVLQYELCSGFPAGV